MIWQNVFLRRGEVRPLWRCLLSLAMVVLAYVFAGILIGIGFEITGIHADHLTALFVINFLMLPLLLGSFLLLSAVFDRRPLAAVGLAFFRGWDRELAAGLGVGSAMVALVAGSERALGLAHFDGSAGPPLQLLGGGLLVTLGLAVAAANEELVFRGYPFQRLVDSLGPVPAVVLSAALFGVAHLGNPDHTWLSTLNTMLVGIPLAVAYLRTRALWVPVGIHFAWNFVQGFVLGLPVSGVALPAAAARARVSGAAWLTGAAYGPEGGVLATAVMAAAALYLGLARQFRVSEAMQSLLSQGGTREEPPGK